MTNNITDVCIDVNDDFLMDYFGKKSKLDVLFQRLSFKFTLSYLPYFFNSNSKDDIDEDDVRHDISTAISFSIGDTEFIDRCNDAMKLCKQTIFWFFLLEKVTQGVNSSSMIFCVLVANYQLKVKQIIGIMAVMFFISVIDSFGNWSRLREKYCSLYNNFRVLKYSKDENRVEMFRKYAEIYGGDELFIDSVSPL